MGRNPTGEERELLQEVIARLAERTKQGKQGWRWSYHSCGWFETSNFFGPRVEVRCYRNTRPASLRSAVVAEPKITASIALATDRGWREYRIVSAYGDGAEDELAEQVRQLVLLAKDTLRQERISWLRRLCRWLKPKQQNSRRLSFPRASYTFDRYTRPVKRPSDEEMQECERPPDILRSGYATVNPTMDVPRPEGPHPKPPSGKA